MKINLSYAIIIPNSMFTHRENFELDKQQQQQQSAMDKSMQTNEPTPLFPYLFLVELCLGPSTNRAPALLIPEPVRH